MKVTHDWEFLEHGNSVHPLSVGMVREDGAELYYEFIQAPWDRVYKHEWLRENVVPKLNCTTDGSLVIGQSNDIVKPTLSIRSKVYDFLKEAAEDSPLELWGWYSAYDHVCLGQLFGAMVSLPEFVPMWTNDIRQESYRLEDIRIPNFYEPGELEHHALDDAKVEMRMLKWIQNYDPDKKVRIANNVQLGNGNNQTNYY